MSDKYLKDMYNDFFGPGSGGDGKPPVFEDEKTGQEIEKNVENDFQRLRDGEDIELTVSTDKGEKESSSQKSLQDADEALREARALFGSNQGFPGMNRNTSDNTDAKMPTATATGEEVHEKAPEEPETNPMDDLNSLIGLDSIKHDVKELTDFAKVQKIRKDEGMKSVPVSLHLVFTGNPGTGKTTVARIISRIYKQIGVLSKGQLVEVDRSGLVAGYVGQTALKTQEKINEALGGVLFIDEAYALSQENDAFGQEAIDTILKAMEDHRDDLVVIVAGYTKPMEKFINSNPGLKSRFNKYIEFPDYSIDELEKIFEMNCSKYEYEVEEDAKKHIREQISLRKLSRSENFANAREIRNLFEEIVTNQARRIAGIETPTAEELRTIRMEDLSEDGDPETTEPSDISDESQTADVEHLSEEPTDSGDSGSQEENH